MKTLILLFLAFFLLSCKSRITYNEIDSFLDKCNFKHDKTYFSKSNSNPIEKKYFIENNIKDFYSYKNSKEQNSFLFINFNENDIQNIYIDKSNKTEKCVILNKFRSANTRRTFIEVTNETILQHSFYTRKNEIKDVRIDTIEYNKYLEKFIEVNSNYPLLDSIKYSYKYFSYNTAFDYDITMNFNNNNFKLSIRFFEDEKIFGKEKKINDKEITGILNENFRTKSNILFSFFDFRSLNNFNSNLYESPEVQMILYLKNEEKFEFKCRTHTEKLNRLLIIDDFMKDLILSELN